MARAAPIDRWLDTAPEAPFCGHSALSMAGSIALLPLVQFDFNPLHLRAKDGPGDARARTILMQRSATHAQYDQRPRQRTRQAAQSALAAKLGTLPEVAEAVSVDSFIPADQAMRSWRLCKMPSLLLDATINPFDS